MVKHPILKDLLKGAKPENIISGFAHYNNFAQLRSNGRLKVGEVGGFFWMQQRALVCTML